MASGSMLKYVQSSKSDAEVTEEQYPQSTELDFTSEENKRPIYNYFNKISEDQSECNMCKKKLKTPNSTTTTMNRHLSSQHQKIFVKYQDELKIKQKNNQLTSTKRKIEDDNSRQPNIKDSMLQCSKFPYQSKQSKLITEKLVEMIALDYQPISIVDDRGFRNFLSVLEKRYVLPSRKTLSQTLIPEMYSDKKIQLKTQIQTDIKNAKSISFTFDLWSSQAQQSYISITCHYLTNKFELKNKTLACSYFPVEHTGHAILFKIKDILKEWDLIKIENQSIPYYFVTDNARNIGCAFSLSQDNFTHILCTSHTLQLAIDDAIKESNMNDLLKHCKLIVTHYNHSNISSGRLRSIQKRLNLPQHVLIQMVDTRWNSAFLMMSRILEQKDALSIDIVNTKRPIFSLRDWQMIEGYVTILKPIAEATKELSREDTPTLPMVLPIVYTIEAKLEQFILPSEENHGIGLARNMMKAMKNRFSNYKEDRIYVVSMMVDPRFKGLLLNEFECVRAMSFLITEIEKYTNQNTPSQSVNQNHDQLPSTTKKSSGLWDVLQQRSSKLQNDSLNISFGDIKKEIDRYLEVPSIEPTEDPLLWWFENQKLYPFLLPVALNFLGVPGTSVCSERLFSKSGMTVSTRRTKILPSLLEKLVFLHDNI